MEKEKSEKVMIKYAPLHEKARFNEIYIKGSRPLVVYKKHALKVLTKYNILVLHAMTAAINKAVELHLWIMEEFPYLQSEITTDSVPTISEV